MEGQEGKAASTPVLGVWLPPHHVTFEGSSCGQRSPRGWSPNTRLSPCHPNPAPGAPSATQKGSSKKQQCILKGCEWQLSSPLSPQLLRSPVISASNPPPSDRTGRMGRVPAAQLWALLSPLRRPAGIFQNGQKTPRKNPKPKPPQPSRKGMCGVLGSLAAGLPAPPSPCPGGAAGLPPPSPAGISRERGRKTQALASRRWETGRKKRRAGSPASP